MIFLPGSLKKEYQKFLLSLILFLCRAIFESKKSTPSWKLDGMRSHLNALFFFEENENICMLNRDYCCMLQKISDIIFGQIWKKKIHLSMHHFSDLHCYLCGWKLDGLSVMLIMYRSNTIISTCISWSSSRNHQFLNTQFQAVFSWAQFLKLM